MEFSLDKKLRHRIDELLRSSINAKVQKRLFALLWLGDGKSVDEVAALLRLSKRSIRDWLRIFRNKGFDELLIIRYKGDAGNLTPAQIKQLKAEVEAGKFHCARQVQDYLEKTFQTPYSLSGTKRLLQRIGCSYHQITGFLFKAKRDKQEAFVSAYQADRPGPDEKKRRYFIDACHPVWGLETVYSCWLLIGQCFKVGVGGGRKRLNILGAWCPQDGEYIDLRQAGGTISAPHVIQLLEKIQQKHPETTEFVIHLDNARYQHARMLKEWIETNREKTGVTFVLKHVPGYSPNLNLIERLWKFLRKHALRQWHETFQAMQDAVAGVLDNLADYREELATLMTEKFRIMAE